MKTVIQETLDSKLKRYEKAKNIMLSFGIEFNRIRQPDGQMTAKREELASIYTKSLLAELEKI